MTPPPGGEREPFALPDYLGVLLHRWWIVIGVTAIVLGIGIYRSDHTTPVYQARGQVEVAGGTTGVDLQTQLGIIASPSVHAVAAHAKHGIGTVRAQQAGLGNIISITSNSASPVTATRTVNATIGAYVAYVKQQAALNTAAAAVPLRARINELQREIDALNTPPPPSGSKRAAQRDAKISQQSGLQSQLDSLQLAPPATRVSVIARPSVPTSPIRPNHRTDALIALGAGLLLGILLAFSFEYLIRSSRSEKNDSTRPPPSRAADVTDMGVLPPESASGHDIVSITAPESPGAQSYRSLLGAVSIMGIERGRCLVVTSAPDRTGKTQAVANLAVGLARARRRVIVVDCDLREPHVHELFGIPNSSGLTSAVRGERLADALWPAVGVEHLYVLPAGPKPDDPLEILTSDKCREVFASLLVGGTVVVVDTPPTLPFTDACTLARNMPVDAITLVASSSPDAADHVHHALDALRQTGVPQVGIVHARANAILSPSPAAPWPRRPHNGNGAYGDAKTPSAGSAM